MRASLGSAAALAVLEPEEADRAGTGVRADDWAERRHELDLGLRASPRDHLPQRLGPLRRVRVSDAHAQIRPVVRARLEGRRELQERLPVPADALDRHDLAVGDREDRLDVEELARPTARAPDSAAPDQVLERVEGEEQPRAAAVML